MEDTWDEVRARLKSKDLKSASWKSDQATLLKIFDKAQRLGVDPTPLLDVSYSNMRTIIKELKQAVWEDDIKMIQHLIQQSATLSNADLRLAMHITEPEEIQVTVEGYSGIKKYQLLLSEEQYDRIKTSTKLFFSFKIK